MSKYRVLARPGRNDTTFYNEELDSIDEAVQWAVSMTMGNDFIIVQVVEWRAEEVSRE